MPKQHGNRPVFTPFIILSSLLLLLPANFYLQPAQEAVFGHPLLARAGQFIDNGHYEFAPPLLIEAKGRENQMNNLVCYLADSCLQICHNNQATEPRPVYQKTFEQITKVIRQFDLSVYPGQFRPVETAIQLFKSWTDICEKHESFYYDKACELNDQNCGGYIRTALQKCQIDQFPKLRRFFARQLKKRLQNPKYGVRLAARELDINPHLLLIHPGFGKEEKRQLYFDQIRPWAQKLRIRAIVFRTGDGSPDSEFNYPLSICEDWQVCTECYDTEADPGGVIIAAVD